jgi:sugar/nucleoside kinase (ribokinase family)
VEVAVRSDYTTVGHVTVDVLDDGTRRVGGSAFYAALQAARLGARARVLTRGVESELEELLAPFAAEIELEVQPAPQTTTLLTSGSGPGRRQQVLAWAGAIDPPRELDTAILHLAPVARETPAGWSGQADFVGLTPQGLLRAWGPDGAVSLAPPSEDRAALAEVARGCHALVLNEQERAYAGALLDAARDAGATVAVTAGERPGTILLADGGELMLEPAAIETPRQDLGAGDVFAAAFFIALSAGEGPLGAGAFGAAAAAVHMGGSGATDIGDRDAVQARLSPARRR